MCLGTYSSPSHTNTHIVITRFINTWSTDMMEEHLIVGLTALALIIETEDFKTFKGEHIDEDDRDILVGLDDEE